MWLGVGAMMLALAITIPFKLIAWLARVIGVVYPPNVVLIAAILFLFVLQFQSTIAISNLASHRDRLTQELALLMNEITAKNEQQVPTLASKSVENASGDSP